MIDASPLEGVSDNVSAAGIMLFTDQAVRVTIELDGPDGPTVKAGRIVRLQRMNDARTGFAIEFDA